LALSG